MKNTRHYDPTRIRVAMAYFVALVAISMALPACGNNKLSEDELDVQVDEPEAYDADAITPEQAAQLATGFVSKVDGSTVPRVSRRRLSCGETSHRIFANKRSTFSPVCREHAAGEPRHHEYHDKNPSDSGVRGRFA